MNPTEIILLISVLVAGVALLRWAHLHGLKQKTQYERDATDRLEKDLHGIDFDKDGYEIFRYIKLWGKEHAWGKTSYKQMRQDVVNNCTKYTGPENGERYAPSEYSIYINKENNVIYYVIGENAYDFSEISDLKTHNNSFKLPAKNQQTGTS